MKRLARPTMASRCTVRINEAVVFHWNVDIYYSTRHHIRVQPFAIHKPSYRRPYVPCSDPDKKWLARPRLLHNLKNWLCCSHHIVYTFIYVLLCVCIHILSPHPSHQHIWDAYRIPLICRCFHLS